MGENQPDDQYVQEIRANLEKGIRVEGLLTKKQTLMYLLSNIAEGIRKKKDREEVERIIEYLTGHLVQLFQAERSAGKEAGHYRLSYRLRPFAEPNVPATQAEVEAATAEVEAKVASMFRNPHVIRALAEMDGSGDEYMDYLKKVRDLERREKALAKKEEALKKKGRARMSKHMIGNLLPTRKNVRPPLPTFYDQLSPAAKGEVEQHNAVELVNRKGEGVHLDLNELRLLLCMNELLDEKIETQGDGGVSKRKAKKYETPDGKEVRLPIPEFSTTLYEIAKKFTGSDNPSGSDIQRSRAMIERLANDPEKKCLMRWTRKVYGDPKARGEYYEEKLETYASLISVSDYTGRKVKAGEVVAEHRAVIVSMHPVFRDQIDRFYVKLPEMKELYAAHGSSNVSGILLLLFLELARVESNPWSITETRDGRRAYLISETRLFEKIAPQYMPPNKRRPKLIKEQLTQAIDVLVKVGMIEEADDVKAAKGGRNYRFFYKPKPKKTRARAVKGPKKAGG